MGECAKVVLLLLLGWQVVVMVAVVSVGGIVVMMLREIRMRVRERLCRQWMRRRRRSTRRQRRGTRSSSVRSITHPKKTRIRLIRLGHDLPLLMNPTREKEGLLFANVVVVLLVVEEEGLKHVVGLVLAGDFSHPTVDVHSEGV